MEETPSQDMPGPTPLVSVATTAYHSEVWLPRAIESVLRQRTDFVVELVIADDASTDGTLAVARRYQEKYPERIRVLSRARNVGAQRNFYEAFEQCRGRYIAWLDADDVWTDPEKLTRQVAVMETDPSVSACGHFVRRVTSAGEVLLDRSPARMQPGRYGVRDILLTNFVPSPSILFRNGVQRLLPPWHFELKGLSDWPILIQSALQGDIVLLDEVMADYMLHSGSAYMSQGLLQQEKIDLDFCERMTGMVPEQWHRTVLASTGRRYEAIAYHQREHQNFREARAAARKAFRTPHIMDNASSKIKSLLVSEVLYLRHRLRGVFSRS